MSRTRLHFTILTCLLAATLQAGQSSSLVANDSFEDGSNSPAAWRTRIWSGRADLSWSEVAHTGQRSVMVSSNDGGDASWYLVVAAKPFSTYRLSGWIRTENVEPLGGGLGAMLNVHTRRERTRALTGTCDWTKVETQIETGADDALWINCLFGGFGRAKGKAWFDDISLELIATMPRELATPNPSVTVNAAKTGEPISKYIYGQFIEHLGRCIYGGIWAEMLEDRKFFYAVGSANSPWKPIGAADRVTMDSKHAFVGEHSPVVESEREVVKTLRASASVAGISQSDLALVAKKKYVGRIWLAGDASVAPVNVTLVWGDDKRQRQTVTIAKLSKGFAKTSLEFTAGATTEHARLEIISSGKGNFRVGCVSLMPADNVNGMRADTLALLSELNAPIYRWPGGNFVSGYDWRDGLGDRDHRPTRKNPAWQGIDTNDFGLDEFLVFCREVKTEPLIVVNTGFGDAHSAAQEVEYANGEAATPVGAWRAKNGHAKPYAVKWWGVGNEMYGRWQLGYMQLSQYTLKHNDFVRQMKSIDPTIKIIAVGDAGTWSEGMLKSCADQMDLISEHFYVQERPGVMAHVAQAPERIRAKAEAHRHYRAALPQLQGKDIRIALDEWNYWYGPHVFGELGTRYFLKDALGIAAGLHEFFRNSDLFFMANYAQTVNVIGAIKTTKTAAAFETTGLVLKMYRDHYGTLPVQLSGTTQPLDVHAALTEDRKTLTIGIVNPTNEAQTLAVKIDGTKSSGAGTRYQIAGDDPMAHNNPGESPKVKIEQSSVRAVGDQLTVAPYSVTVAALETK